jgi:hypothetical protein
MSHRLTPGRSPGGAPYASMCNRMNSRLVCIRSKSDNAVIRSSFWRGLHLEP